MNHLFNLATYAALGAFGMMLNAAFASVNPIALTEADLSGREPPLYRVDFGLQHWNYGSNVAPGQKTYNEWFDLRGEARMRSSVVEGFVAGRGMLDTGANGSFAAHFGLQDAYIGSTPTVLGPFQVSVGRRRYAWSQADQYWNLGIWQPRIRWDYLRQEQVGLAGVFFDADFEHGAGDTYVHLTVMATPAFIPEVSGGLNEPVNGSFPAVNDRWHTNPPAFAIVEGQSVPLYYQVAPYRNKDIVMHGGAAVSFEVGKRRDGPYLGTNYAYKPMNQIQMGYDGNLALYKETGIDVPLTLNPYVYYHHLVGLDGGYRSRHTRFWTSLLFESPDLPKLPANMTSQNVRNAFVASVGLTHEFFGEGLNALKVNGSYLHRVGGNDPDQGPLAKQGVTIFEDRYPFAGAFQIGASAPFPGLKGNALNLSGGLIYDPRIDVAVLNFQLASQPVRGLSLTLGADILGTNAAITEQSRSNWLVRYSYNDRVYGGVRYAF